MGSVVGQTFLSMMLSKTASWWIVGTCSTLIVVESVFNWVVSKSSCCSNVIKFGGVVESSSWEITLVWKSSSCSKLAKSCWVVESSGWVYISSK